MTLEEEKKSWAALLHDLKLSPANTKIAEKFLVEQTADESVLSETEPRNLCNSSSYQREQSCKWMEQLRQAQKYEDMARYVKFCWAVGKSTAIYLLEPKNEESVGAKKRRRWGQAVGEAAVAAMGAEKLSRTGYPDIQYTKWLHDLAKDQPELLEQAQTMGGASEGNMRVLLAGILLASAPYDQERIDRQCGIILQESLALFKILTPKFTPEERVVCTAYLEAGDPNVPVPLLSGGKMAAYDARGAMKLHSTDRVLTMLLGTASFLAQQHDSHARCAVRLYAKLNPCELATGILTSVPRDYLMEHLELLCDDLPGHIATLLLGLGYAYYSEKREVYREIMDRYKSSVPHVINLAESCHLDHLSRYLLVVGSCEEMFSKGKMIDEFISYTTQGVQELSQFLRDEGSLANIPPERMKYIQCKYGVLGNVIRKIKQYYEKYGWDTFLCRYTTALLLVNDYGFYLSERAFGWVPGDGRVCTMDFIHSALEKGMPMETVLLVMGSVSETMYTDKERMRQAVLDALDDMKNLEPLCRSCQKSGVFGRSVSIELLEKLMHGSVDEEQSQKIKQALVSCAGDASTQVRTQLAALYAEHPEWGKEYQETLLNHKKSGARLMMAGVLASFGDTYVDVLKEALEKEKNVKVADRIREVLGEHGESEDKPEDLDGMADRMLTAVSLKKLQWLFRQPLPVVRKREDKSPVREERIKAILVAYCELGRVGISETAAKLAADLEPADLQLLANEVFERWMDENAPSKHKWVLAFAAVFGGAVMTPKLRHAIQEWPEAARGAIACEAVNALVLSPDPAALMIVDGISRKFKFRQIKQAAAKALTNAAHELGIEPEELADRIVPDLGFSAEGRRVFDYGPRQFTVSLTPTLELSIKNDSGKVVKSMPAPGKTDDEAKATAAYSEFKEMKKQIRTTVAAQKGRLELALSVLRCWDKEAWERLFVKNPIMHQFAMSLIWGIYEDNKLTDTFRYMEDGSFNTVDEEEYDLPEHARIGLVHPIELDEEMLGAWKQQLADYEITQSIQQLDRPIYRLDEDPEQKSMKRFGGKMLTSLALYGKLQKFGWYRGSVQDAGGYYEFYKEDASTGMGVELHFSGAYVAYNEDEDITVYDAVFYRAGTVARGSYVYDSPSDGNIFTLGEIPARYYSEIVYQLEQATASSTQTNADWEKEYQH